jgi:hypothetical protein
MGKASRTRTQSARQKIAAQQAAQQRKQVRRRAVAAAASVILVLAVVVVLITVKLGQTPARAARPSADAAVATQVTHVPAAAFNRVGAGTATGLRATRGQPLLTRNGKPEVLFMGGQFCPYCAAERWAIASAVSRFGVLSGLQFIHSSPTDSYPDTPTLSFARAHYASKYLAFVPVEWYGEGLDPSTPFGHVYLQHPTSQQVALFSRYGGGSIPFLDIGNQYLLPQAQYLPSQLAGLTWAQVAAAMRNPSSQVGKAIDGASNMITAAICHLTHGQPGAVCRSAGVAAAGHSI